MQPSTSTNDNSGALLSKDTSFLRPWAVIPSPFAFQETKHATGALSFAFLNSVGICWQGSILTRKL
jgi:hypothetical protein